jgi:hypothetical protein
MDAKAINDRSYPVVPIEKFGLPLKQSRYASYPLAQAASDEIIDYVEIQTNNYRPAVSRKTPYPFHTLGSAIDKGTLIDLWI